MEFVHFSVLTENINMGTKVLNYSVVHTWSDSCAFDCNIVPKIPSVRDATLIP